MDEKKVQAIMNLIIYGGDGKSSSVEAIQAAKEGNFELADEKIKAAEESLLQAHHTQTEMLTQEANGDSVEVSLLMVHGQDHLMTGMMFKDLAKEIVDVYRTIGGFQKQLELKKFKLFFLCIMHKEEGEENDKPRVVQSKQKEIM